MPLNKDNTRTFHRTLYAGQLETVTLLKRDDDQQEGTVRSVVLFDVRFSRIRKAGQPLRGDVSTGLFREIHIPRIQLDRVGVAYINVLDRFVDQSGRTWQPETDQPIQVKLFENHVCVMCRGLP